MDIKKLIWRAVRGTAYAAVSAWLSGHVSFLPPEVLTSIATGLLLAIDKALGVGGLIAPATK